MKVIGNVTATAFILAISAVAPKALMSDLKAMHTKCTQPALEYCSVYYERQGYADATDCWEALIDRICGNAENANNVGNWGFVSFCSSRSVCQVNFGQNPDDPYPPNHPQ